MRLQRSQLRILLAFALLTPVGLLLVMDEESSNPAPTDVQVTSGVDYFIQQANATTFNTEGRVTQTLHVSELNHFPNKSYSELRLPKLLNYDTDNSSLSATADKGTLYDVEDRLVLDDEVKVEHNSSNGDHSLLTTSTLTLLKSSSVAETSAPVTIVSHGSVTHADGIRVDFKARTTELSANVKGTYDVNQ